MPKAELVDLELFLHYETKVGSPDDGAIRVSEFGVVDAAIWLPKSQIEFTKREAELGVGTIVDVTLPEWLAKDKNLI